MNVMAANDRIASYVRRSRPFLVRVTRAAITRAGRARKKHLLFVNGTGVTIYDYNRPPLLLYSHTGL